MMLDLSNSSKPFLIVGDVHGCGDELEELISPYLSTHQIILVGDMFDRGKRGVKVWEMIHNYDMRGIMGNHEKKFLGYLTGKRESVPYHYNYFLHNFGKKYKVKDFIAYLESLPLMIKLNEQEVVVHAGIDPKNVWKLDESYNVYGKAPSAKREISDDMPWRNEYDEKVMVYYGHLISPDPVIKINSIGLDTGACHGGKLTGYLTDKKEIISVGSRDYFSEIKSLKYAKN